MDLSELYHEIIVDHHKSPRRRKAVPECTCSELVFNPLCGDKVAIAVRIEGGVVEDIGFDGHGCSISQASASILCDICSGKPIEEVRSLKNKFDGMIRGEIPAEECDELVDGQALVGVRRFPARIRCAAIAWEALGQCIEKS